MSYTNAVFYIDDGLVSGTAGSDAVRSTISAVVFDNPSADVVRGTKTAHGLVTGAVVTVSGCGAAYANDVWKITQIDADTFTVDGASWASWNDADVTGDLVPFGGSSWADAWQTITSGATAARIAPGDTIRVAKSPDPVSVGNATWTDGPPDAAVNIQSSTNATPIVVTAPGHGLVNGDFTHIASHTVNTNAKGLWRVANVSGDTFELEGSVGNGVGGATGTTRKVTSQVVYLDAAQTAVVDTCESAWTAISGSILTVNSAPTAGGTGYALNDILTITTGGTQGQVKVTGVSAGVVTAVTLYASGRSYSTGAGKATSGGTGSGCTVNIATYGNNSEVAAPLRQGVNGRQISCQNVAANSPIAFHAIAPGSLAGYQQLSLSLSAGIVAANVFALCLCSDSAGATIVDTFPIPALPVANTYQLTISRVDGGNLGASIGSVALYCYTTAVTGAPTVQIDNLIACTSTGLSLTSLISKNSAAQGGTEAWHGILSIEGRIVRLDSCNSQFATSTNVRGYSGKTENVATYHRRAIAKFAAGNTSPANLINDSGTIAGGNITFSGGWNPGGTQDGATYYDGGTVGGYGYGLQLTATKSYVTASRFGFCRYNTGLLLASQGNVTRCSFSIETATNCLTGISIGAQCGLNAITALAAVNCSSYGVVLSGLRNVVTVGKANSNGLHGLSLAGQNTSIACTQANNNAAAGIGFFGATNTVSGATVLDNGLATLATTTAQVQIGSTSVSGYLRDCTVSAGSALASTALLAPAPSATYGGLFIWSINHNGGGYNWGFSQGATVNSEATDRAGGTGVMWRISMTDATRISDYPVELPLAQIACAANKLVTVKAWMKKSHATNVAAQLLCKGGQITGVAADVTATKADDTAYEQLTITFTPTVAGVVEINARAWYVAGTGSVVVEDLTITQAA